MSEIVFGCFDWNPLAAVFNPHFLMVRQNVPVMVKRLFELMEGAQSSPRGDRDQARNFG